jgi:hypothetical protein
MQIAIPDRNLQNIPHWILLDEKDPIKRAFDHTCFTVYFKNLFVYDAFDSFPETTISPNRLCRLNGQAQIRIY